MPRRGPAQPASFPAHLVLLAELLLHVLIHQRGLADPRISQDDDLQQSALPSRCHGSPSKRPEDEREEREACERHCRSVKGAGLGCTCATHCVWDMPQRILVPACIFCAGRLCCLLCRQAMAGTCKMSPYQLVNTSIRQSEACMQQPGTRTTQCTRGIAAKMLKDLAQEHRRIAYSASMPAQGAGTSVSTCAYRSDLGSSSGSSSKKVAHVMLPQLSS